MADKGSVTDKGRSLNSIKLEDFPENEELAEDFFDREYEDEISDVTVVMPMDEIGDDDGSDGLIVRSVSRLFDDDDISAGNTTFISREEMDTQMSYRDGSSDELEDIHISADDVEAPLVREREEPDADTDYQDSDNADYVFGEGPDLSEISIDDNDSALHPASLGADSEDVYDHGVRRIREVKEKRVQDVNKGDSDAQGTLGAPAKRRLPPPGRDQISRNPASKKQSSKDKQAENKKPQKPIKVKNIGTKKHSAAYHVIKFCIFLLIWIAVAFVCYQGYKFGYSVLNDQPMDSTDASKIQVTVSGNETDDEMGEILKGYGLIDDIGIYKWRCRLYSSEYKPGTYRLSRSYNTEKILNILAGYTYSDGTIEEEESSSEETVETVAEEESTDAAYEGEEEYYEEG